MATYSGLPNSAYYSEKVLNEYNYTQIENVLFKLPNNTNQLINPKMVRDSIFTMWENISLKNTGISATARYIGIDDDSKFKFYFGKKSINNSNVMSSSLLNSDTDIFFYNIKGDTYSNTKVTFLAGTNTNIFTYSPYIQSKQVGTSAVSFEIINEGGDIIIGNGTKNVKIYGASGSIGMLNAVGSYGTLQVKGTANSLVSIPFGNIGSALVIGTNGYLTFSAINNGTYSAPTIEQVLRTGNKTTSDLILNSGSLILSTTPSRIIIGSSSIYDRNNILYIQNTSEVNINSKKLTLNVATPSSGKFLMSNDSNGVAIWTTISDKIDYDYIQNKPTLNYLNLSGGVVTGSTTFATAISLNSNIKYTNVNDGIIYQSGSYDETYVIKYNTSLSKFLPDVYSFNSLADRPNMEDYVSDTELSTILDNYATTFDLSGKQNINADPDTYVGSNLDTLIISGEYFINDLDAIENSSLPSELIDRPISSFITVRTKGLLTSQILYSEINNTYTRYLSVTWTDWVKLN